MPKLPFSLLLQCPGHQCKRTAVNWLLLFAHLPRMLRQCPQEQSSQDYTVGLLRGFHHVRTLLGYAWNKELKHPFGAKCRAQWVGTHCPWCPWLLTGGDTEVRKQLVGYSLLNICLPFVFKCVIKRKCVRLVVCLLCVFSVLMTCAPCEWWVAWMPCVCMCVCVAGGWVNVLQWDRG